MLQTKCVVIGGGTGSFSVLSGIKQHFSDITALVSMADDGGSTGVLRDDMGVLPPGDVRKCLVALSDAPGELRDLFNYRYADGALGGHTFGNIFLSTVEKMTNDFDEAVRIASDILRLHGSVVPITLDNVRLTSHWPDGSSAHGQHTIDSLDFMRDKGRPVLRLEPVAAINPRAAAAIDAAQLIIISPGDLYTSLGALLVVDGVAQALAASTAHIVYICNLVIKSGQTDAMSVADHAAEIERFAGGPILDTVLYNTAEPPAYLSARYQQEGAVLVQAIPSEFSNTHYRVVGEHLIDTRPPVQQAGDALAHRRSYIRHDSEALARAVADLVR